MLPDPFHPAVVHFPIVLAILGPLLAGAAFWAIQTGRLPQRRAWIAVVAFQGVLVCATWAAVETGEHEEERVERVMAERYIDAHEEDAERLFLLAGLALALAAAGLLAGRAGSVSRGLTVALGLAALAAAGVTGHSGGELVYTHGAAAAYVTTGAAGASNAGLTSGETRDHDDDDD